MTQLRGPGKPLIRIELRGGLGNQLFQAAAALNLARRIGAAVEFDVSRFHSNHARGYALGPFPHGATAVPARLTIIAKAQRRLAKIWRAFGFDVVQSWQGPILHERSYSYDDRILSISDSCYLSGYFQSWRYFTDIADELKETFDPSIAASQSAKDFATRIGPNDLSIHIRAGDYKSNPEARAIHGVLPADYYHKAMQLAETSSGYEKTFCFSDSSDEARRLLGGHPGVTFVEGFSSHDDLYLMSRCRSHIIANSTFSYWGAWLGRDPGGIVIAPKAWFTEQHLKRVDVSDLYPPDWATL